MSTTTEPKYTPELCDATEKTLRAHNLRLRPGIELQTVLETLEANHVTPSVAFGSLICEQSGLPSHTPKLFEALAQQQPQLFIPRETSDVKCRDELDLAGKTKFIREQGLSAWESLPQKVMVDQPTVLDQRRMTRSQWLNLDRKTRAELAGRWGASAVGGIMARK